MTQTIEQLQAKVAEIEKELLKTKLDLLTSYGESEELLGRITELEAEVERLSVAHVKACQANADSQAELAAEQLNNKLLRDALEFLNARIVTMDLGGVVERALSIPASTEALDKYVAEKLKETKRI